MVLPAPIPQTKFSATKTGNGGRKDIASSTTAPVITATPISRPRSVRRRASPTSAMLATIVAAQKAKLT